MRDASIRVGFGLGWAMAFVLLVVSLPGCFRSLGSTTPSELLVDRRLDFEPVDVGQSARRSLLVLNRGGGAATIERVIVESGSAADTPPSFTVDFAGPLRLARGDVTWIEVTYTSYGYAAPSGTVVIFTSDEEYRVGLKSTLPEVDFAVLPSNYEFSRGPVGECEEVELVLENAGQVAVEVTDLSIPDLATEFQVDPEALAALPVRLGAPGDPTHPDHWAILVGHCEGPRARPSTDLTVGWTHSDGREEETVVSLSVDQTQPCLQLSPEDDTFNFGEIVVGATVEQSFRLENCARGAGAQALSLDEIVIEPAGPEIAEAPFTLTRTPDVPALLEPVAFTRFSVAYSPSEEGVTDAAVLSVRTTDVSRPLRRIELTGTGVAAP